MKIATGDTGQAIVAKSANLGDFAISFTNWTRADRTKRQVIEAIEAHETAHELTEYMEAESLVIDALHLFDDSMAADIDETFNDHHIILTGSLPGRNAGAPAPIMAIAQSPKSEQRKNQMFATNQTEGSQGPWMTWTANGSAAKQFPPKSWVMRGKDANGQKFESVIEGFANPCVFDLESLKLGWEKDGAAGQAPDRRYSSHYSVAMPRPDESKKNTGAFAWSNCLQVRVAISQTEAVTWEQGAWGAYQAFAKLARLIEAQHPGDNTLPVVKMIGVEERAMSNGSSAIPILEIVKWVQRPDCLKADVPAIATAEPRAAPIQQQAAAAAATPPPAATADQSAVSAEGGF